MKVKKIKQELTDLLMKKFNKSIPKQNNKEMY